MVNTMENKRVFIGWNGDENKEVAFRISNFLSAANFSPIVGGEWKKSFTVSEEIINQMKFCEFAIFLLEKEVRKDENGTVLSIGLNPNVMMELGYMLHKVKNPNHTRRILVDLEPKDLPSDLQGTWTVAIKKDKYTTEDEREEALTKFAREIADDFLNYIKDLDVEPQKLVYLDKWMDNAVDIYNYNPEGEKRISEKLIYGLQAAIYSNEYERLYDKLKEIRSKFSEVTEYGKTKDKFNDYPAVSCAIAILKLFVETNRLTKTPNENLYDKLKTDLEVEYEVNIEDENLKSWCEIFRKDKLELLNEIYAAGDMDPEEKIYHYEKALEYCNEILNLIEIQVEKDHDPDYALLYKGFIFRNMSQISKALVELEPEKKEEYLKFQEDYCHKSFEYRKNLFDIYNIGKQTELVSMDFIRQEYILALAEEYQFKEDYNQKREIRRTLNTLLSDWEEKNNVRNMIFNKIKNEVMSFSNKKV